MIRKLLAIFGYHKVKWGYTCGRHWVEIDGFLILDSTVGHAWMRDDHVNLLQKHLEDNEETES
jgi:hypothetical protein